MLIAGGATKAKVLPPAYDEAREAFDDALLATIAPADPRERIILDALGVAS